MTIIVEPKIFSLQNYGGISRYYCEIFSLFSKQAGLKIIFPISYTDNIYFESYGLEKVKNKWFVLLEFLSNIGISVNTVKNKINRRNIRSQLKKNNFDLVVLTYYDTKILKQPIKKPFVLTVYDMIHELLPHYFPDDPTSVNKKLLIEKATKIIAVSNNTKKDILKFYPEINPNKIDVIYHGSSLSVDKTVDNLPSNYILFVGSRYGYKNFELLLKSCENILKDNTDLYLVCAGGGAFTIDELIFIESLDLFRKIQFINFEENQLGFIYNNAKMFIFPSQYEGFGIPVLEAMSCGCPIVLTHNSIFEEVAEDAGLFFENNNEKDLENKIILLLTDETLRCSMIENGYIQARKYSWTDAAKNCLKTYQSAIKIYNENI